MEIRVAVRYMEFKCAKRLPKSIPTNCAACQEIDSQDKFNCGGYGNPNYRQNIGHMEFYQCPLSIFNEDTWNVIDLVLTSIESGIPVTGNCLLDQTKMYFRFKNIINSEKFDCHEEIEEIRRKEQKQKEGTSSRTNTGSRVPRRTR